MFPDFKYDPRNVLAWFKVYSRKTDSGKCQFMVLRVNNIPPFRLNIKGKDISCSNTVKLGEIINHNKFKFKKHIENLCKKASVEFHALRRIRA